MYWLTMKSKGETGFDKAVEGGGMSGGRSYLYFTVTVGIVDCSNSTANIGSEASLFCRRPSAKESGGPSSQSVIGLSGRTSLARRGVSRDGVGLMVGWLV